jgi:hypothetical protein
LQETCREVERLGVIQENTLALVVEALELGNFLGIGDG